MSWSRRVLRACVVETKLHACMLRVACSSLLESFFGAPRSRLRPCAKFHIVFSRGHRESHIIVFTEKTIAYLAGCAHSLVAFADSRERCLESSEVVGMPLQIGNPRLPIELLDRIFEIDCGDIFRFEGRETGTLARRSGHPRSRSALR